MIVCGVDRSVAARGAARLGAALAARVGLPLLLAHAAEDGRAGRALLARLRREIDAPHASLHVGGGPAAALLAEVSRDATLLAVGGDPAWQPLGGRVRGSLARRCRCPLAIVPPVPRLGGREVLCGVRDWADVAAAEVAARLAQALGLELTLVHVLPAGSGWRESGGGVLDLPCDDDGAHGLLEAVARAVDAEPATHVVYGPAGPALAREAVARDTALLVIGPPSYGRVGSMLNGSASTHLLRRTRRPLLVCPPVQRRSADSPLWPPLSTGSASGSW